MQLFFDLLIALLLSITAIPAVILLYSRTQRKNSWEYHYKKISFSVAIVLLLSATLTLYGSLVEPRILTTTKYTLDLPNITEPIKIIFLADLQLGKYKQTAWMQKVVDKISDLQPDLIFIGGDQVDNENYNLTELEYLTPLKILTQATPVYAIHGNHEYGVSCFFGIDNDCSYTGDMSTETKLFMEEMGIKYLVNDLEKITINSSTFYLFGGDSYWAKKLDYSSLDKRTEDIPTIALIHNPSHIFSNHPKFDLTLSGHTHGGQVRLPFIGPVGRVDTILPGKYYQGLHKLEDETNLLVSSGAGETGARARLFNPPEIVLVTIK